MDIQKPDYGRKTIRYWKVRYVNVDKSNENILVANNDSLHIFEDYKTKRKDIIDNHAPAIKKEVTARPNTKLIND